MKVVAFDFETDLIPMESLGKATYVVDTLAPRAVCGTFYDGEEATILLREDALDLLEVLLQDPEVCVVGANVFFDLGVAVGARPHLMPLIFQELDAGRVGDVQVREKLLFLQRGWLSYDPIRRRPNPSFSLATLVRNRFGHEMSGKEGEDVWRLRYIELDNVPLDRWPEAAKSYALDDAIWTWRVYQDQRNSAPQDRPGYIRPDGRVTNEEDQTRAGWALHLCSSRGFRTRKTEIDKVARALEPRVRKLQEEMLSAGLMRQRNKRDGTVQFTKNKKAIQARVARAYQARGLQPPKTESSKTYPNGQISTSRETLASSQDPLLEQMGSDSNAEKLLNTYIPVLYLAAERVICHGLNLLLETGRTSARGPNTQNQPRDGGIRECIVPSFYDWCFVSVDYSTQELVCLAQVCLNLFGESAMADAIREGKDLHLMMAARILGISYQEASDIKNRKIESLVVAGKVITLDDVKDARQLAKVPNFGFPGGMGAAALVDFAWATYRRVIPERPDGSGRLSAEELKAIFMQTWPEMKKYFDHIGGLAGWGSNFDLVQQVSGRIRGDCRYTAGCNSLFQGLAADASKRALYLICREAYTDRTSFLYGSYPVFFVHDEVIVECHKDLVGPVGERVSALMVEAMTEYCPDVPVEAEPAAAFRWYKGMEPVFDEDGDLVPWVPNARKADGNWGRFEDPTELPPGWSPASPPETHWSWRVDRSPRSRP